MGCSLLLSAIAANLKSSLSSPLRGTKSVTSGFPLVRVPVLSKITAVTFSATSRASAFFIRIPSSAPFPIPTVNAVGVARPKAQGQATTRTAMSVVKAKSNGAWAMKYQ